MTTPEDLVQQLEGLASDLRVGAPEREAAREALEEHLAADRLDPAEHERRRVACQGARTQAELLELFADLPAPHPGLPGLPARPEDTDDEELSTLGAAILVALLLGLPVAVVLGLVYGAWWTLAVPVALSGALLYIEHLLTRGRE